MDLSKTQKLLEYVAAGNTKEVESFFNQSLQLKVIGATVDLSDPKRPVVILKKIEDMHRGGILGDAINGGVISMLIDLAIGLLGLPYYGEGYTATQHLSIHFVKPLNAVSVRFEAEITGVVGNRIFGNVNVVNEKGDVCSFANGVLVKGIRK
jgi:acyl-coenzyme A thioesterase PaaI-like protein